MGDRSFGRCELCREVVRWVTTIYNAKLPLHPDMCPDGNFVFTGDDEHGKVKCLSKEEVAGPADRPRYKHHAAVCLDPSGSNRKKVADAVARIREQHRESAARNETVMEMHRRLERERQR